MVVGVRCGFPSAWKLTTFCTVAGRTLPCPVPLGHTSRPSQQTISPCSIGMVDTPSPPHHPRERQERVKCYSGT